MTAKLWLVLWNGNTVAGIVVYANAMRNLYVDMTRMGQAITNYIMVTKGIAQVAV